MKNVFKCVCYEQKHEIGNTSPEGKMLIKFINELGENIKVTSMLSGKSYMIPRIYIAVHGLKGDKVDYDALHYGFKEVN